MDQDVGKRLLREQLVVLQAAAGVLRESHVRVGAILKNASSQPLSIAEKESCEALTARFARLCDFLFQRAFRTIDRLELSDEGTGIDRLNRMEKRGVIASAAEWRDLRELRNSIAHEYLIEKSDQVLKDAYIKSQVLFATVEKLIEYVTTHAYV